VRRLACIGLLFGALLLPGVAHAARPGAAALQVALHARGLYQGPIDGVIGPLTTSGVRALQRRARLPATGRLDRRTRLALGVWGRPLLGRRELGAGAAGWDVSSLEFRLRRYGLPSSSVDGRFDHATVAALQRFQSTVGLAPDGIAGPRTFRALARARPAGGAGRLVHSVRAGESIFSIAEKYRVSPWLLAKENRLSFSGVIVPGQRLTLPAGARLRASGIVDDATPAEVRAAINHWSAVYGVDPALARALAWMESGFQPDVVSNVGAIGVMQLLPETWSFVDEVLIGHATPRTADGNVQAGVRYLRWQLDEFGGNVRLALAGWYQGARAVREIGLYDDTRFFVSVVTKLYGTV
jgi:soluble lytic murein transglycosylase-like protein